MSNPIQQRMEHMAELWTVARKVPSRRVLCLSAASNELDMVDAFYMYMLGIDSPVEDIAFLFDSVFEEENFSQSLLAELDETIQVWNTAKREKSEVFSAVKWRPELEVYAGDNNASLFVRNFNSLAKTLALPKGVFVVAVLSNIGTTKRAGQWLMDAMDNGISENVRFLFHESVARPFSFSFTQNVSDAFIKVPLELNMAAAIEQAASMGDPADPDNAYRHAFVKMMSAMEKNDEKVAERFGKECLSIATINISHNAFWIAQVVVVNCALANDKLRYKNYSAVIEYADKAVDASNTSIQILEVQMAWALQAQAHMSRGTYFTVMKNRLPALQDFEAAFDYYQKSGNPIMAIEAGRMVGELAQKLGYEEKAVKALVEAVLIGKQMNPELIAASTHAGVMDKLQGMNYKKFMDEKELDQIGSSLYGLHWKNIVSQWKEPPKQNE